VSESSPPNRDPFVAALKTNYVIERRNGETYAHLAALERDGQRAGVLKRLADAEFQHAAKWAAKLKQLGAEPPPADAVYCSPWRKWLLRQLGVDAAVRRMEAEEEKVAHIYLGAVERHGDDEARRLAHEIKEEEESHARVLAQIFHTPPAGADAGSRLTAIIGRERHRTTGGWLGSAIYGVNDGLGAVFGIVSGMAGYGAQSHVVLAAGLAGTIASALSMGSGAWLATKSEREAFEAEVTRERREIELNPEEEREELELMYQLKGFSEDEAKLLARRMAENPDQLLKTKLHEELSLSEGAFRNPWTSAFSAGVSTAIGAFIPLVPFFVTEGTTAVIWSLAISIAAHFVVGAAKTLVTGLNWFKSGMEMTIVSVIAAVVTYGLGYLLAGHGQAFH
jgi:predicted membrane protein (TIGR00267 family)